MRRYQKGRRRDREDLEARLNALQPSRSKSRRKRRSNAGPAILGILLVIGVLGVIYLIYTSATSGSASQQADTRAGKVEVVKGDTLSSVADKLDEAGVVSSATLFKLEARLSGQSTEIKPGEYTFGPDDDTDAIMKKLTTGKDVPTYAITIPEGLTLQQTAETVAQSKSGISAADFEKAAKKTDYGYAFLKDPAIKSTEGYLFPKKYDFEKGTTAPQIVNRLLEQYLLETQELDFKGAEDRLNLSEYELVTVASLIEKEAASPEEKPIIASVIYNRMRQGMPLQIDATIQYARGKPKEDLSLDDLEIDSPYNTYKNPGLPPGPICSPSRESLEAAIEPKETDYVYYVLKANGQEHYFTNNYNDFLQAKAEAGR
ncbi:MAG TPA: endolytic transglycosylase MltG [Rubrobacteraceae bacterium]|nr:endolytic transglycosylase MltG [Rubrobacteraceae bacterium]